MGGPPPPALHAYESPDLAEAVGPVLRPGGLRLTRRAAGLCGFAPGARVVDVGCGLGAAVEYLTKHARLTVAGIDISPALLAAAGGRCLRGRLVQADAMHLPLQAGRLDGAFCECVISLLPDPARVLSAIRTALAPGGMLAVSDLYLRGATGAAAPASGAPRGCLAGARSRSQTDALFEGTGWRIRRWEDHTPELKHFAAQLVFSGIPLDRFLIGGPSSVGGCRGASSSVLPGFGLWILRKENHCG